MAVVLKTTKVQAFGGSNPSPSANLEYDPYLIASRIDGGDHVKDAAVTPCQRRRSTDSVWT